MSTEGLVLASGAVDTIEAKRRAAEAAVAYVEPGMTVGLGSGSTARWFILELGRRCRAGLSIRAVATSGESEEIALTSGISLIALPSQGLDIAVDGADAVDPALDLIKGGGGAHVRERIVAAAAERFVVVVDDGKLRSSLAGPLPLELLSFGLDRTMADIQRLTAHRVTLRRTTGGDVILGDNGNVIADTAVGAVTPLAELARALDAEPGVVGHGLFLEMADVVVVGRQDGSVDTIGKRPPRAAVG